MANAPFDLAPRAPDYPGLPIVGPLFEMRRDYLQFCLKAARQGDFVRAKVGPVEAHFLNHPDHVQHVLVDRFRVYEKQTRGYKAMRRFVGLGLLTSEGDFWKRQRRIAQPAFGKQRVAAFGATMVRATEQMLDQWQAHVAAGTPFDVAAEMMRVTLQIVGETLMSTDLSASASAVGPALEILLHEAMAAVTRLVELPESVPTPANRRFVKARATLDTIVVGMIEARRKSGEDKGDLLSMLMNARDEETGEGMTDRQLRDEAMTLLLAGHETTANLLAWALWLLSEHPAIEARVRTELAAGLQGRAPTVADLGKLPYLHQVIKEALRLYPPAWILARSAASDDVLGGFRIPKGSYVFMSPYTVHRHPAFWDRPDAFEPERWAGEGPLRHKYQYFPFSVGGRKCIGDHFATMEAALVLATILQRVQLRLVPGHPVEMEPLITLRPKHGLQMVATPAPVVSVSQAALVSA